MSLRDEIKKSIEPNAKSYHDEKIIAEKVLNIIEKRIDKLMEENQISMDYYKNKDLAVQGRSISDVAYGQDLILRQIKELLK